MLAQLLPSTSFIRRSVLSASEALSYVAGIGPRVPDRLDFLVWGGVIVVVVVVGSELLAFLGGGLGGCLDRFGIMTFL